MKKFISESWLVVLMGVVFAGMLAGTQSAMVPKIRENERRVFQQAITEVVPDIDPEEDTEQHDVAGYEVHQCFAADGSTAGWAVKASGAGFVDTITLVAGLDPTGRTIVGIKVINHTETPGLGNKIETRGEEHFYPLQYVGKKTDKPFKLLKGEPSEPYEIQAITGATYSSQYVMDIVNAIIAQVVPELPLEKDAG